MTPFLCIIFFYYGDDLSIIGYANCTFFSTFGRTIYKRTKNCSSSKTTYLWGTWINTHMSVLIEGVVGQLDFLKGDVVLHPLSSGRRRIWMDEESRRHLRFRLSGNRPLLSGELVPAVVGQDEVHQDEVLGLRVEPGNGHFHRREHSSGKKETFVRLKIILIFGNSSAKRKLVFTADI